MSLSLRDYQQTGVEAIRAAFRAGRKAVAYIAPTGSGKGIILAYIAAGTTGKSNRLFILVHRQELIRQSARALEAAGVSFGIIAAGHAPHYDRPVQLAMVATLTNRLQAVPEPHFIIIDETHHVLAETYREILMRFPSAKLLGLTATPQRLDGKGLGAVFEELILGPTVQELIDQGYLARPIYFAPPTELDMAGVKRTAGDFNRAQVAERVDRPTITGSAVEHYGRICPGRPAVVFCASIAHSEHVRDQFIAAGWPAASIDGKLGDDDRIDRVAALAEGRIKILTSVDVISEGFDLPSVSVAILLRPTESLGLHLQSIGRVLRPKPDGGQAWILDHVGNCRRHGLAEEPREWSLAGRPAKKKGAKSFQTELLTCTRCFGVHPPAPACPNCGEVYPVKVRKVAEVDGQLAQLTAAAILAERDRVKKRQDVGRAQTYGELVAIAKARGYSDKWPGMMMAIRAKKKFAAKVDATARAPQELSL